MLLLLLCFGSSPQWNGKFGSLNGISSILSWEFWIACRSGTDLLRNPNVLLWRIAHEDHCRVDSASCWMLKHTHTCCILQVLSFYPILEGILNYLVCRIDYNSNHLRRSMAFRRKCMAVPMRAVSLMKSVFFNNECDRSRIISLRKLATRCFPFSSGHSPQS